MPVLKIKGVDVDFPFTPYACQEDYMSKVIQCLQEKKNGILESPTGTGKTLCLLCATLAWRESFIANQQLQSLQRSANDDALFSSGFGKELSEDLYTAARGWGGADETGLLIEKPKIIYASRTHSQLSQAIQQLKDTSYRPKVCIIGSREQLCIHPEVASQQNNNTMVHMCRAKVGARTCHFYNKLEEKKSEKDFTENILDIEDLVKAGQKHKTCPYYMARELKTLADIIFMPYNYLLDPKSRRTHSVELRGNILIFDEAHNVEKMCEESVSFDFTSYDMASCVSETSKLLEKNLQVDSLNQQFNTDSSVSEFDTAELYQLKALFLVLEEAIDSIPLPADGSGVTKPGSFIYELLTKAQITFETYTQAVDLIEKIISHLTNNPSAVFSKTSGLQKFSDIMKIVFNSDSGGGSALQMAMMTKYYRVHIHVEDFNKRKQPRTDLWTSNAKPDNSKSGKTLSCWCFCPGFSMRDLAAQDVRSIVLTSGTLSPLESFTSEMQINFPIKLENPHVIEKHQMLVGIVTKGPDGTILNSSYQNRFSPDYIQSLGNAIVNYSRIIPNGLLVFFPSYPVMNKCMEVWQETGVSNRICQYKPMFVEPKNKAQFHEAMEDFYQKINDPALNGAAFFAVCRGKVSEGLDFADNNGRAVVITGLPFPPRMDAKVNLKMKYLDEVKARPPKEGITGRQWYRQQASRAVNQAIGRVIRHKEDYGAIILCDNRFTYADARAQLPSWVRPYVKTYENFGLLMRDLMNFFKSAEKTMPKPKPKARAYDLPGLKGPTSSQSVQKPGSVVHPSFGGTASYSTKGRTESHQASLIVSHVPSLKRSERLLSEAKLTIMYEAASASTSSSKSRGLLDALDEHEKKSKDDDEFEVDRPQETSKYSAVMKKRQEEQKKKVNQKKKIVIVKPSLQSKSMRFDSDLLKPASGLSELPSTAENSKLKKTSEQETRSQMSAAPSASTHSGRSMKAVMSAQEYIIKAKQSLSASGYKTFSKLMADYKKTSEFPALIAGLADLFIEDPAKHDLFRNFYKFVRPFHKKEFDQVCRNLTGMGCGYKPEDSLQRQRLEEIKSQGAFGHVEKRKRDADNTEGDRPVKIPLLSESNSVSSHGLVGASSRHLDTTTHLNQGKSSSLNIQQSTMDTLKSGGVGILSDNAAKRKGRSLEKKLGDTKSADRTKCASVSEFRDDNIRVKSGSESIDTESSQDIGASFVKETSQGAVQLSPVLQQGAPGYTSPVNKHADNCDASQSAAMSVGNSDVTECGELDASLSLFSGESSALDTSIDSVSGTPGKSKGKKKKKKHKHRRHSWETVTSNADSERNSGKGKEAARDSLGNSTQDDRNVKHKKNHRKPGALEDNPDTSQTFAESNSSHSECKQDESEAMDVDSSFPSSSDSAHNVENGDERVITKEKENLDDEDNLWDSFSRKSLDSMKNGQLFESHVKSCRSTRGPTCIICKQSAVQPLKAKCQHICCKDCWRQYIKEHKQCPQCGQHTKKRHLQKLFFPHGHGQ